MKLEREFDINWQSVNFLEERVTEPIWEMLYQHSQEIPKYTKVKLTLEFI